ncbi:hypothetical protein DPMN_023371 [Dreissena polymorpha]|uniref:Uncharacterized protein n=1 Tax=Dreissena polymorpha TaxID=45954 RepID=A0A9D4LPJ2_DREPO|nr:hypothetical protein DPMN_023371 [Dreissena polymorpha]
MRVYCVFHSVQQNAIKHLSWDGKQCDSSIVEAGDEVAFLGKLDEVTLFHSVGISSSSHILLKSGCSNSTVVPTLALSAFVGMLSGPADLPFFNGLMSLLISSFVGVQHLIGRSLVAGKISGGFAGAGLLSSSWKCSIQLYLPFIICYYSSMFVPYWPLRLGKCSC